MFTMALSFLLFIGAILLAVLAYVLGLMAVRRHLGVRHQNIYNAIFQCILASVLDLGMIFFSIAFCTAATSDALRLRGHGTPNQFLESVSSAFGTGNVDNATLYGLIIPALSWATAHAVVVLGLLVARSVYQAVQARRSAQATEPDTEAHREAKTQFEGAVTAAFGYGVVLGLAYWAFRIVVTFDTLLVRYQIIHSSKALTRALGKDWMARLNEQQLYAKLGSSFLGQIVVHAGLFYVAALLVTAFLMVVALHNLTHHLNSLPRRRYMPGAPPLDMPAGVWNGTPVTVQAGGAPFGGNGHGPNTTVGNGTRTGARPAETEWYRAATDPAVSNGTAAPTGQPAPTPVEHHAQQAAVDVPLQAPPAAETELERLTLAPSE